MAGLRIGTYIDTLELENEALREKVKALEHRLKLIEKAALDKMVKGLQKEPVTYKIGLEIEEERNPVY